jgi:ankyrin repeat protein
VAAQGNRIEAAKLLIELKADVNQKRDVSFFLKKEKRKE